jgi:predicted nucleic acid-binding protein
MNGPDLLLDTNIVIYFLEGDDRLSPFVSYNFAIPTITEIELLGWVGINQVEITKIKGFLAACEIVELNKEVKNLSIGLKQRSKLKTPDAIIAATALHLNIPLVTADRGFNKVEGIDLFLIE